MKYEIKHRYTGAVLFSGEFGSLRICVEAAVSARVSLAFANLSGSDLSGSNLSGSNLSGSNLSGSDLSGSNLSGSNLYGSNLYGSDLSGSDLSGSNLYGSDLYGSDLSGSNLYGSDLYCSNLYCSNLSGAKNAELVIARTRILPEGDLIGWKKCNGGVIVKLRIPANAKRSHAFGRKCRAERAEVLEIIGADKAQSIHQPSFTYRAGETVQCDGWCDDWQQECAGGIHFYITREEAEAHE